MTIDYAKIKAERGPEVTRYLAAHEIGHASIVRALGNQIKFVTLMPQDIYAGQCVSRGAKSLNFVADSKW